MTRIMQLCFLLTCAACLGTDSEIDGTWEFTYVTPNGDLRASVTLKAEGENLIFVQDGREVVGSFKEGEFTIEVKDYYSGEAGYSADLILKGEMTGGDIKGRWTFDEYSGTFSGRRSGS